MLHPTNDEELNNFMNDVDKNTLIVVQCSTTWCGPCRKIAPDIAKTATDMPSVRFIYVDGDKFESHPLMENVQGFPTFQFFKNGELIYGFAGANIDVLLKKIEKYT